MRWRTTMTAIAAAAVSLAALGTVRAFVPSHHRVSVQGGRRSEWGVSAEVRWGGNGDPPDDNGAWYSGVSKGKKQRGIKKRKRQR